MSDWHFGMDYDMWLYPPVDWTAPDYDYELPEPIEAANIEGTLLVNAEDAIEQVHCLQAENSELRERIVRCRDCKHGHITVNGKSCKWCDLIATHDPDGCEPYNGYDPEPYFDADFFCAWGKRREVD